MHALVRRVAEAEFVERCGRVVAVRGQIVDAQGPAVQIGERCHIVTGTRGAFIEAEVIGFRHGVTVLMPFGSVEGLSAGALVVARAAMPEIPVGHALLGRVIDAFGAAVDGKAPLAALREHRRLDAQPPAAMQRRRVTSALDTGIKVIDSMLTLAKGQRIGLFAGSGVGKSSLMGMLARGTKSEVNVIALIGERSREVREFVEDQLGSEGLARSIVVVATASEPAVVRIKAAYAATTIAEYFRDRGKHVVLMMDSLTRFAMARREIGLALGEPPTARGYTPSVFSEMPRLCERCGPGETDGSITGVYTVLVDGDDLNEPVSDTLRATLDGHIILSRDIANAGQYPAVDVLSSISRIHSAVGEPLDVAASRKVLACCAVYERNRQLIEIGAYKPGVSAELDRAVRLMPAIREFFAQAMGETASRANSLKTLRSIAMQWGAQSATK